MPSTIISWCLWILGGGGGVVVCGPLFLLAASSELLLILLYTSHKGPSLKSKQRRFSSLRLRVSATRWWQENLYVQEQSCPREARRLAPERSRASARQALCTFPSALQSNHRVHSCAYRATGKRPGLTLLRILLQHHELQTVARQSHLNQTIFQIQLLSLQVYIYIVGVFNTSGGQRVNEGISEEDGPSNLHSSLTSHFFIARKGVKGDRRSVISLRNLSQCLRSIPRLAQD